MIGLRYKPAVQLTFQNDAIHRLFVEISGRSLVHPQKAARFELRQWNMFANAHGSRSPHAKGQTDAKRRLQRLAVL
jgi:hypothetical protein